MDFGDKLYMLQNQFPAYFVRQKQLLKDRARQNQVQVLLSEDVVMRQNQVPKGITIRKNGMTIRHLWPWRYKDSWR